MDKEFELLRQLPFFQDIPRSELESSSLLWSVRDLKAGEHLWWQGQPPEEFAFLCSGRLTVHIADEDIAEITVDEMLGEAAVFTGEPRSASISATPTSGSRMKTAIPSRSTTWSMPTARRSWR